MVQRDRRGLSKDAKIHGGYLVSVERCRGYTRNTRIGLSARTNLQGETVRDPARWLDKLIVQNLSRIKSEITDPSLRLTARRHAIGKL